MCNIIQFLEDNTQLKRRKEITVPYFKIKGEQINRYETYLFAAFIMLLALNRRKQKGRGKMNAGYIRVRKDGKCAGGIK